MSDRYTFWDPARPTFVFAALAILLIGVVAWPVTLWRWRRAPRPMSRRRTLAEEYRDTEHFGGEPPRRSA